MAVSGWGLERLKPPIPLFKRRLRASFFMRFIASSRNGVQSGFRGSRPQPDTAMRRAFRT